MKKQDRFLALILAVLMLLGLTACSRGAVTGDNQSWKGVWDFRTKSAISDDGYYYSVNGSIWFADLQSGTTVPLCTKAGCAHDGDTGCDVYIMPMDPMFFSGDSLYSIELGNYGTTLYRRDATGAAVMKVTDLGTKYTEDEKVLTVMYFGSAGDYLYYCATVAAVVYNEEVGGYGNVDEVQYISRVDLKTGKETYIIEDPVGAFYDDIQILAVREDGVLFAHKNASDVRKNDAGYQDILDKDPVLVKCWNSGTGEITTVLETTGADFMKGICVTAGKICYSTKVKNGDGTWRYGTSVYDLDTGKKEMLYEEQSAFLGEGYLLRSVSGTKEKYVYDLAAGKEHLCTLPEGTASVQIASEKGAVICIYFRDTTPTENRYYFVTREAMADGIQNEDLLYLYTKKYST